jgi:hypothetical protein
MIEVEEKCKFHTYKPEILKAIMDAQKKIIIKCVKESTFCIVCI